MLFWNPPFLVTFPTETSTWTILHLKISQLAAGLSTTINKSALLDSKWSWQFGTTCNKLNRISELLQRCPNNSHLRTSHEIVTKSTTQHCYTGCIKKMVIELSSALARSIYNLQKSFFYRRKDQAFSFRLSPCLWNFKKDWVNTNQKKIADRDRIFPPLSIIMAANKKIPLIIYLSRETINVANKTHQFYYLS